MLENILRMVDLDRFVLIKLHLNVESLITLPASAPRLV